MSLSYMLLLTTRGSTSMSRDSGLAVLAHPARRRDSRNLLKLAISTTRRPKHSLDRLTKGARRELDPEPASRHHNHDASLERVELRHPISRLRHPLAQSNQSERVTAICQPLGDVIERDPLVGTNPHGVTPRTVLGQ
jgi:hypothetical protein